MPRLEGQYVGSIAEAVVGESKSGKEQVVITFDIDGGQCRVFLSMSDAAWPYTEDKLRFLGFNGDFTKPAFSNGNEVPLNMKIEEHEGKTREKWDIYAPLEVKPASPDKLRVLNARWKSANSTPGKPTGAPTAPPSRPPTSAPSRPAASTAAPSRAPAREPAVKKDKDWAWGQIENPKQDAFFGAIEQVEKDEATTEDRFGPDQWEAVVRHYIPI